MLKKIFNIFTSFESKFFYCITLLPYNNSFLAILFNNYFRVDEMLFIFSLFKIQNCYFGTVRNFFFIEFKYFFSYYFRNKESLILFCNNIIGIIFWSFG